MSQFDPTQGNRRWMPYVILAAVLLWLGLWALVQLPVTGVTRTLFLVVLFGAIATAVMPPIAYLNARFGHCRSERIYQARFVRQSVWLGLLVSVLGWLQIRRILTMTLTMILIAVFVLTETFLLTRDRPSGA